jgi:hypothetical protein
MSKKIMAMPRFFAVTGVVGLLGLLGLHGGISHAAEPAAPPATALPQRFFTFGC